MLKLTNKDFTKLVSKLCREISLSNWRPDYVVGIVPTGLVAATMVANYLDVPLYTLHVHNSSPDDSESNLWMAEEAFGYPRQERYVEDEEDVGAVLSAASDLLSENPNERQILIVDSLNVDGSKFNWIKQDWQSSCLPNSQEWKFVWNNNVKFATLIDFCPANMDVEIDYVAEEMAATLIEFPYDKWW